MNSSKFKLFYSPFQENIYFAIFCETEVNVWFTSKKINFFEIFK
jgi:hypothetical protein